MPRAVTDHTSGAELYEALEQQRRRLGMTRGVFARHLGLSLRGYDFLANGRHMPNVETCGAILVRLPQLEHEILDYLRARAPLEHLANGRTQ